jgi:hypothetical protein
MSVSEFATEAALKRHYIQVRARLNRTRRNVRPPVVVVPEPIVEPEKVAPEKVGIVSAWGQHNTTILLDILKRQPSPFAQRQTIARVRKEVSLRYGITEEELCSAQRNAKIVLARHIAMYVAKKITGKSLPEIGRLFGGKDHTTILNAVRRIQHLVDTNPAFAAEIEEVKALLG